MHGSSLATTITCAAHCTYKTVACMPGYAMLPRLLPVSHHSVMYTVTMHRKADNKSAMHGHGQLALSIQ